MHILYISYDGMTDPLGQSQVIPYLEGLSDLGWDISIISAEKKKPYQRLSKKIKFRLDEKKISWLPLPYTSKPPVLSTVCDILRIYRHARKLHKRKPVSAIHCRSYMAALIGLKMKRIYGIPFIFDMRGFWADERIEGGIWSIRNPLFRQIYKYFKKEEKIYIAEAAHVVCLTNQGKAIVNTWQECISTTPVSVIPCCVDTHLFSPDNPKQEHVQQLKMQLSIPENSRVLCYLGSIGTWYMADEMMVFFRHLQTVHPDFIFLFITPEPADAIVTLAEKHGVDNKLLRVYKADRDEVPVLLKLATLAVFFIKPVFSKKASSPTKQGEVMGMGIPLICNAGIGDTTEIVAANNAGIVLEELSEDAFQKAVKNIEEIISLPSENIRLTAIKYFSLDTGIEAYHEIYKNVTETS